MQNQIVSFLKMVAQSFGISTLPSPKSKEQVERPVSLFRQKQVALKDQRKEKDAE